MAKKIMSFYEFMMKYDHEDPNRRCLADNMRKLAGRHKKLKQIDSLTDLMIAINTLTDPVAKAAVTGSLWCEYCAISGHPMTDEQ